MHKALGGDCGVAIMVELRHAGKAGEGEDGVGGQVSRLDSLA
jgi:hypothetical protein